jgi:hypothetical protein
VAAGAAEAEAEALVAEALAAQGVATGRETTWMRFAERRAVTPRS